MNILTGASKTGKSAIIDIVDYVTGRSECNVADGVIRKYVGWYALLFQLDEGQIFVARRNPEVGARTSGDVCLARASQIETPPISELVKNITVNALESFLGAAIGISENEHRPPTPTRDPLEANFRHALLFSFQDQNDIDSKQRLFHRQGEDYVGPPRPRLSDFRPAFPAHYPPERDANGSIDGLSDEDQTAVLQLFKVLSDAAKELTPGLQIIVLDHADLKRDWFDEAVVERWRRGKMLVPPDWIK
jgi:hypothetical protein